MQKKVDKGNDATAEIEMLTKNQELDNKEIDTKISQLEKKDNPLYGVQKERLEQQKKEYNDYYNSAIKKLSKPSLIAQAIKAVDKDLPEYLRAGAKADIEAVLREAAEQLNSSESEAKTARSIYGETISDIALKLYPDAKTKVPEGYEEKLVEITNQDRKLEGGDVAKEEVLPSTESGKEVGGGVGGDVESDVVQNSEYKGVTGTTSVTVKEKDGIIKATFKGTRSDKPGATIGASGYRYGGRAVKETLSDFEKDYGVKVDEIIDGVEIAEITVLEERAEVNPRQGVGTGQSVTLRIRDVDGNIINDVNILVNKRKFTEQSKAPTQYTEAATPKEQAQKIADLTEKRDRDIAVASKPDVKLEFVSAKELVDSKDPIGNRNIHNDIKERFKKLKEILDCIHG